MKSTLALLLLSAALGFSQYTPPSGGSTSSGNTDTSGSCSSAPSTSGRIDGDTYKCTDSDYVYLMESSAWSAYYHGVKVVPPTGLTACANAAVSSSTTGGMLSWVNQHTGSYYWSGFCQSVPAAPYTIIAGVRCWTDNDPQQLFCNLIVNDASGGGIRSYGTFTLGHTGILRFTGATNAYAATEYDADRSQWAYGQDRWIKFVDDNTNFLIYISSNRKDWTLIQTQARNTTFTPDKIGMASAMYSSNYIIQMDVFDWQVQSGAH